MQNQYSYTSQEGWGERERAMINLIITGIIKARSPNRLTDILTTRTTEWGE